MGRREVFVHSLYKRIGQDSDCPADVVKEDEMKFEEEGGEFWGQNQNLIRIGDGVDGWRLAQTTRTTRREWTVT